jgi:hypothetical protein
MPVIEAFRSTASGPFWLLVGTKAGCYHRWLLGWFGLVAERFRWLRAFAVPRLVMVVVAAGLWGGCGPAYRYEVKTDLPWPDEWVGPRVPFDPTVLLASETLRWHREAPMGQVAEQVRSMLKDRADLYCFVRQMVAQPVPATRSAKSVPYLEVKIAARFFGPLHQPGRMDLRYEQEPLTDVLGELAARIGRGYLLSPQVAPGDGVTGQLSQVDPREAMARVLLDRDLFVEPVWYNPVTLRSYEYRSQASFLAAVTDATAILANPDPQAPLSVVPLEQWAQANAAYQRAFRAELRQARGTGPLGSMPATELLSTQGPMVKKQILYALAAQLRTETQPE